MKKILTLLALVVFLGSYAVPAVASTNSTIVSISIADEDPKKPEAKKSDSKQETKEATKTTEKKSSDCTTEHKTEAKTEKKSSDCATGEHKTEAKAEKKSDGGCGK